MAPYLLESGATFAMALGGVVPAMPERERSEPRAPVISTWRKNTYLALGHSGCIAINAGQVNAGSCGCKSAGTISWCALEKRCFMSAESSLFLTAVQHSGYSCMSAFWIAMGSPAFFLEREISKNPISPRRAEMSAPSHPRTPSPGNVSFSDA